MKNNVMCVPDTKCTGCSSCMNVCPVDAIRMEANDEGFIMPMVDEEKCIDCGRCVNICPALHVKYDNEPDPKIYAAMADDDIRAVSSSGGMFTLLAEQIIDEGGLVFGAAFDKDFQLNHTAAETKDALAPLRGSKYVQSNIGMCYRDVKNALKNDRKVLFTGTPCQVAGLKAFLGKDHENLYTMDILCHGVPSQIVFKKYLEETAKMNNTPKGFPVPTNVSFRDKRYGWNCENMRIEFDKCQPYERSLKQGDMFEFVFHRNLALRKCCSECPFAEFPRQGDISVGDFWGISRVDRSMTDQKGTSFVTVNSEKGKQLFSLISDRLTKVKELAIRHEEIRNRVRSTHPANKNRGRFMKMVQNNSLEESVKTIKKNHFDVGLVSNFYAGNFGGALTQYALYHVLEDFGYSTLMIERPRTAKGADRIVNNLDRLFIERPYPDYAISPMFANKTAMRALNEQCDTFVVGSDQLFQYALFRVLGEFVTLDWVSDTKKKIAYAASFGHDKIWGDPKVHSEMAYFMQKFDAFSVREESGVRISREEYGVDAEWVLDPVFLCDPKHYHALSNKATREIAPNYIGGYILDPSEEKQRIFKAAMEKMNMPCEIFSEYNASKEYTAPLGDLNVPNLRTEERLQNIINCDFFITDSFHGTCFAIIMKRPFISIMNQGRGASRFKSLLSMLHLEHRLIESEEDLNRPDLFTPIDFDAVHEILNKERARCKKWLLDALQEPKVKCYSDYDMMIKLIDEQNSKIEALKELVLNFSGNLSDSLSAKVDIIDYLETLSHKKAGNIIIVSVKDTPGLNLDSFIAQKLKDSLGISSNLEGKHSRSFAAVINDGEIVFENLGNELEPTVFQNKVADHDIYVSSRVYKNGNEALIKIDESNFSLNRRGLNFVVYDKIDKKVIDAVTFDTHQKNAPSHR